MTPMRARAALRSSDDERVTPTDEYLLTMMRLRTRLRLQLCLIAVVALLLMAVTFFVYPREIVSKARNATLVQFKVDEGLCKLNFSFLEHAGRGGDWPFPPGFNVSQCVPNVTGKLDLTVRLRNDNWVTVVVHRYFAEIQFANLTLGGFHRDEPLVMQHGFTDVRQLVDISSVDFSKNVTLFTFGLLGALREVGKGHFAFNLHGQVDASVLGIMFNTTVDIPLLLTNSTTEPTADDHFRMPLSD